MGERVAEEHGALCELASVLADGPHDGDELLARACRGLAERYSLGDAAAFRLEHGVLRVVARHEPGESGELALPPGDLPAHADVVEAGSEAMLVVPLVDAAGTFAAVVGRPAHEASPSPAELRALTAFGSALGAFVEQAERLDDLRRLDQAKGDFVSVASHELRTPISVVHGVAATLHHRGHELSTQQLDDLRELLFEQTTKLAELTNQLLDLSRIDAGAVRLRSERFSPRERFETLLPRLVPEEASDVRIEIDPGLEIVTDPDAFERVVSNLIVNALRYGSPPVVVRGALGRGFRLVIEDSGDGVDPALVPRLFDRFTRGDQHRRAGVSGAGLGLAIASSFASALGGELAYETGRRSGARFVFRLPVGNR